MTEKPKKEKTFKAFPGTDAAASQNVKVYAVEQKQEVYELAQPWPEDKESEPNVKR